MLLRKLPLLVVEVRLKLGHALPAGTFVTPNLGHFIVVCASGLNWVHRLGARVPYVCMQI